MTLVRETAIFIGVGTSAQVYPAAGLLSFFRDTPEKYFIDPHPAHEVLHGFTILQGSASEMVPVLVKQLLVEK